MTENNVTLNDLAEGAIPTSAAPAGMPAKPRLDSNTARPANIDLTVKPDNIAERTTGNPMLDKAFENLETATSRIQEETNEIYQKGVEERLEQALESDDDDVDIDNIDDTPAPANFVVNKTMDSESNTAVVEEAPVVEMVEKTVETSRPVAGTKKETIVMAADESVYEEDDPDDHLFDGIDDEDMKYLDDDDDSDEDKDDDSEEEKIKTEQVKENIREEIDKNFSPISHKITFDKMIISKKPINAAKVINEIKAKPIECADGVLFSTKRAVRMSAWKPMEIQSIDPNRLSRSNYNKFIENKLELIYDHLIDANKPKTFEAWAMITPNTVVDDYMFTAYKATFGLSNIITFSCGDDNCNKVFMESLPINSMIKFKDDKTKEEYMQILHEGNTDSVKSDYDVTLYQASDEYVFGLKVPSLYNTYIEPTLVNQEFNKKYEDRLILLSYIDAIYKIDYVNNQLIPIDTKPIISDKALTYKRRIKTFDTILKSLTSDQLMALSVETDKYDGGKLDDEGNLIRDITYIYPEKRCPKCGKVIEEQEVNPDNMLFTRHQLGLMKKI